MRKRNTALRAEEASQLPGKDRVSFWKEHPEWVARGPKTRRPPPTCKEHGVIKVRQHGKAPYRCPECEREAWEQASQD
jgi:predicted Zn-ribbon and HTH transcriptional regulator